MGRGSLTRQRDDIQGNSYRLVEWSLVQVGRWNDILVESFGSVMFRWNGLLVGMIVLLE